MFTRPVRARRGFSLVELVMAIAVMGIALAGAVAIFATTARHSADPMIQQQAQLIAEAYLDEILIKRFYDPDTNTVCTGTTAGETRQTYDNVCDYHNINGDAGPAGEAPRNQLGTPITELSAYNVEVTVDNGTGVSLNGITNTLGPTVTRVLLVTITVTGPNNTTLTLNGYRTNYECNASGEPECKPN